MKRPREFSQKTKKCRWCCHLSNWEWKILTTLLLYKVIKNIYVDTFKTFLITIDDVIYIPLAILYFCVTSKSFFQNAFYAFRRLIFFPLCFWLAVENSNNFSFRMNDKVSLLPWKKVCDLEIVLYHSFIC